MTAQLKGILFDFDDTLVDWSSAEHRWREIETQRLTRVHAYINRSVQPLTATVEQLVENYAERTTAAWQEARAPLRPPDMIQLLLDTLRGLGVADERLVEAEVLRAYDWNLVPGVRVFPDVPPLLDRLRACGIKVGIVTNASQSMRLRDVEVRGHGLMDYFPECRIAAVDVGYLKPHPRIFEAALGRLNTQAAETVFVGDDPVADIGGAQAAGMRAVLRIKPKGRQISRGLTQPDASVRSFDELPPLLDRWYPGWCRDAR